MPMLALLFLLSAVAPQRPPAAPSNIFSPIFLYRGTWHSTPAISGPGVDTISNQCYEFTRYFACQQTVNGKVGALVVYVYAGTTGHYYNQAVLPMGYAAGRGDLLIEGDHWTFSSNDTESGKTTYYRTTNQFHGTDQIHFEVAHSADGKIWVIDHKGDERRVAAK